MITFLLTFLLNVCRTSKSITLPQVTSDIVTFSRMVRFSCVLPLWKAIELTIMPVLTVLKNIENWPFYSQSRKTWHFFWDTLYISFKCKLIGRLLRETYLKFNQRQCKTNIVKLNETRTSNVVQRGRGQNCVSAIE